MSKKIPQSSTSRIVWKTVGAVLGSIGGYLFGIVMGMMFTANFMPSFEFAGSVGWEAGAVIGGFAGIILGAIAGVLLTRSILKEPPNKSVAADIFIVVVIAGLFFSYGVVQYTENQARNAAMGGPAYDPQSPDGISVNLREAIYNGNVDAVLAMTYPGSTDRALIEQKMPEWRKNRFNLGGESTTYSYNRPEGADALLSIDGVDEQFNLKEIEGKWYLVVQ